MRKTVCDKCGHEGGGAVETVPIDIGASVPVHYPQWEKVGPYDLCLGCRLEFLGWVQEG